MMNTLKKFWNGFLNLFGLRRNTRYVKTYLDEANMRSGVFMSAVIVVLEIWLVIRQTDKYVLKSIAEGVPVFQSVFTNLWTYFLLLSFGAAMLFYCLNYIGNKKDPLLKTILTIVFAGISLILCCFMPYEFQFKAIKFTSVTYTVRGSFKIAFYVAIVLFNATTIIASILRLKGKQIPAITSVLVISLFALVCLLFGVMISYGDFVSTAKFESGEYQHKQIICFLMMAIYVGCLLIWKPMISIGILGVVFLGFYFALKTVARFGGREVPEGDEVNYITFFISLAMVCVSIYNQRVAEGKKDEELERLAKEDSLTGLMSFQYFVNQSDEIIKDKNVNESEYLFVFINIASFKIYNDQKGFEAGNVFLKNVGELLKKEFAEELVSRQSDDHFVIFAKKENIEERLDRVDKKVLQLDAEIKPGIKAGAYILKNKTEDPRRMVEKARYACAEIKYDGSTDYIVYDQKMHDNYHLIQYVIRHIDDAIANGHIKPYYQPVVWSKNDKLCGVEALARWVDPRYGFMNPGVFVGALESSQMIYKLDVAMLKLVCQDIKRNREEGIPIIPVSINFSRLDFAIIDVPATVESILNEYGVDKDLIHVEITESALQSQGDILLSSMKRLKENGFALWLDDFGSGYSSLNALKDYDFDVMKLDMQFLVGFGENEKSKAIIKSAIQIAKDMNMRTLCEGVETKEQVDFLRENNCERLQGYYFGKPYSYDDLKQMILDGKYVLDDDIVKEMKQRKKA